MTIYEHRDVITVSGGSANTLSLRMPGGLCRQVLIRALTDSTTVFRADLTDENSVIRRNYGYHTGEINDTDIRFPVTGRYTINITNASLTDTFRVILAVQEK